MWQKLLQNKLGPISTETEAERNETLAAVLLLLSPLDGGVLPQVLLTKRTMRVETHKGQMSFPGGFREPEDSSWLATALRETSEEVGVEEHHIQVLGRLEPVWTRNQVKIIPFVGQIPSLRTYRINTEEVEKIVWLPLDHLMVHGMSSERGIQWEGELIWGATAKILEQLWTILKSAGNP